MRGSKQSFISPETQRAATTTTGKSWRRTHEKLPLESDFYCHVFAAHCVCNSPNDRPFSSVVSWHQTGNTPTAVHSQIPAFSFTLLQRANGISLSLLTSFTYCAKSLDEVKLINLIALVCFLFLQALLRALIWIPSLKNAINQTNHFDLC